MIIVQSKCRVKQRDFRQKVCCPVSNRGRIKSGIICILTGQCKLQLDRTACYVKAAHAGYAILTCMARSAMSHELVAKWRKSRRKSLCDSGTFTVTRSRRMSLISAHTDIHMRSRLDDNGRKIMRIIATKSVALNGFESWS